MRQTLHGIIVALLGFSSSAIAQPGTPASLGLHPAPPVAVLGRNSVSSVNTFTHTSNYDFTSANSGNTIPITLPSTPSAGQLVTVCVLDFNSGSSTPPTATLVDGAANAYTMVTGSPAGTPAVNGSFAFLFYWVATGSANPSLTFTASSAVAFSGAFADVFAATGGPTITLDSQAAASGSLTLPVVPLVTGTNDLLVSCVTNNNGLTGVVSPWIPVVYKRKRTGNDVGDFSFRGGDTLKT
jgi:hypothetical protein